MTDEEICWLQQHCRNVEYAPIAGVGHLLHLEDQGQAPVRAAMLAFLQRSTYRGSGPK